MQCFWILDQVQQGKFEIIKIPGQENLSELVSRHHTSSHHKKSDAIFFINKDLQDA